MTSFQTLERSLEDSRPLEIVTLTIGSAVFNYTSNASNVTVDLVEYEAIAIRRSSIDQGVEARRAVLTLTVPANNPYVAFYLGTPPGDNSFVVIKQLQRDEVPLTTRRTRYMGTVQSVRFVQDGQFAEISCTSVEAFEGKTIPRYSYSGLCNHVLYGPGCGVNPSGFLNTGIVTAVNERDVTVSGLNVRPVGYFNGGYCRLSSGGDYRFIIAHSGNNLTLLLPFVLNPLAGELVVYAGCDHRIDGDCDAKFANRRKHGGWPYVPNKNIFATGLQ